MDKPVIVLGAGGHAKVVIDALIKQGVNILGIVDSDLKKIGTRILGFDMLGDDDTVLQYSKDEIYLVNGIGSIGATLLRKNIFTKFISQGYKFMAVIHPSAVIASDVEIKDGAQIMAGVVIQTGVIIGSNAIINTGASVDHDCIIHSHAHISPGVTICGGVSVGEGAHIGTGTTVIQGVNIGSNVVVGAGSLVLKNITRDKIVYGSPAKEVKE